MNLQLATIDEVGDPDIQPVWFEYDKDKKSLFIMTPKTSKKAQNIRRKSKIYFSIDDENFPYKGVKGKGEAKEPAKKTRRGRTRKSADAAPAKEEATAEAPAKSEE